MKQMIVTFSAAALMSGLALNTLALEPASALQGEAMDQMKQKAVDQAVETGGDMAKQEAKKQLLGDVPADKAGIATSAATESAKDMAMEKAIDKGAETGKSLAKEQAIKAIK